MSKGEVNLGICGYKDALNFKDLATGVKYSYPTMSRDHSECIARLKLFGGTPTVIKRYYGDKEGGLAKAAQILGIQCRFSEPGRPVNNTIAERANQDILGGSRSLLAAAGLHSEAQE